jgi:hypothetical protein
LKEKTNGSYVDYKVAYNQNEFFLDQLFQIIEQKFQSEKYFHWKNMDLSNASSEFKNKALEIVKSITEETYVKDADLKEHVNLYQKVFQNNQEVVIVSHSQGNFYAQSALNFLGADGSLDVPINFLGVATPFKITADYVTLTSDGVINIIPGSPPANTSNTEGGWLKHQFVRDYLKGDNSGKTILKKLSAIVATKVGSSYGRENNPGYVHSSLSKVEKWVNSIENYYGYSTKSTSNKQVRRLKRAECLAISIFYKTANWYNAPCESRNLTALIDGAKSCYNENWRGSFLAPMARCSLPGTTAAMSPWSANYLDDNLAYGHPECAWSIEAPRSTCRPRNI